MVKIMENPIKMDDLGVPILVQHPSGWILVGMFFDLCQKPVFNVEAHTPPPVENIGGLGLPKRCKYP